MSPHPPPPSDRLHEHSFNDALADVLREQLDVWPHATARITSERKGKAAGGKRPDILIEEERHQPIAMETEFANKATPEKDAIARLGIKLANNPNRVRLAVAVIPPEDAEHWPNEDVRANIATTQNLKWATITGEGPKEYARWPESGWIEGTVRDLAHTSKALAIPAKTLAELAKDASDIIRGFAKDIVNTTAVGTKQNVAKVKQHFEMRNGERAMRAAAVIWLNALLMQKRLAQRGHISVEDPRLALTGKNKSTVDHTKLIRQWQDILDINYLSIFGPAKGILELSWDPGQINAWLAQLHTLAVRIEAAQLGSMVDVGGELYPKIVLEDRSAAAAYYTRAEIAEMLGWILLPNDSGILPDWGNNEAVANLRVGDFACGTGTLLRAAYRRIRHLHASAGGNNSDIHRNLMERGLVGIDISASAAHLTSTGLASMEPSLPFSKSQVGMAHIGKDGSIGALDGLTSQSIGNLFGDLVRTSEGRESNLLHQYIDMPDRRFDAVIMNPPYTRAKKGEHVFDVHGMTHAQRQKCLKNWGKAIRGQAEKRAGLGASFTVLAHQKLKVKGRLGIVLPMSISADKSWQSIRRLLAEHYNDLIVVNVTHFKHGSLSADTAMGEVLVIGTKAHDLGTRQGVSNTATFVNLKRGPLHFGESIAMAQAITAISENDDTTEGQIRLADETIGTWTRRPVDMAGTPWEAVGVADSFVAVAADQLRKGYIRLPDDETADIPLGIPMTTLDNLLEVGPTHHLIGYKEGGKKLGAFKFINVKNRPIIRNGSLWETRSAEQTRVLVSPTHQGIIIDPDEAKRMLKMRSDLLLARSVGWANQKVSAVRTEKPVMGGPAFTALLSESGDLKSMVALWLNSTFGLMVRWVHGSRQQPGRSRLQIGGLKTMPIPDFRELPKQKLEDAQKACEQLSTKELLCCGMAHADETRKAIDDAVCDIMQMPRGVKENLSDLRELWCREPTVHANNKRLLAKLPK